jgi:hypothetical protein
MNQSSDLNHPRISDRHVEYTGLNIMCTSSEMGGRDVVVRMCHNQVPLPEVDLCRVFV